MNKGDLINKVSEVLSSKKEAQAGTEVKNQNACLDPHILGEQAFVDLGCDAYFLTGRRKIGQEIVIDPDHDDPQGEGRQDKSAPEQGDAEALSEKAHDEEDGDQAKPLVGGKEGSISKDKGSQMPGGNTFPKQGAIPADQGGKPEGKQGNIGHQVGGNG